MSASETIEISAARCAAGRSVPGACGAALPGRPGSAVLFLGGVAAMAVPVLVTVTGDGGRLWSIPFLAGFLAVLLSPWPFSWAGLARVTRTRTTADGGAIRVDRAHSSFRDQIRPAQR